MKFIKKYTDNKKERYIPEFEDDHNEISYEHKIRYASISKNLKNKVVLDAACGSGYGTKEISKYAKKVIGIDIDESIVEYATDKYKDVENLSFRQCSISDLPFKDNCFDCVVSFETIEHVDKQIQNMFLLNVLRVLKDDGVFVISTPNKKIYSDLFNYKNEFHIKEFYIDEFHKFLKKYFDNVKLYYQNDNICNTLTTSGTNEIQALDTNIDIENKYVIAVCSNIELMHDAIEPSMIMHTPIHKSIKRVVDLQKEVEEKNQWALKLQDELNAKDKRVVDLQKEVEEKNQWALKLQDELDIKNIDLQQEVEEKTNWSLELDRETKKNSAIVEELQKDLKEKTNWTLKLQDELNAKDKRIVDLQKEVEEKTIWSLELDRETKKNSAIVEELQKDLKEKTNWALKLQDELNAKDKRVADLQQEVEEKNQWAIGLKNELNSKKES